MSSAGHVMDAINRMAYNRRQLVARREKYSDLKSQYEVQIESEGFHFKNDEIPKEKLELIKERIRIQIIRKRRRTIAISITISIVIASFVVFLAIKYFHF